jgi:hypothetical protein
VVIGVWFLWIDGAVVEEVVLLISGLKRSVLGLCLVVVVVVVPSGGEALDGNITFIFT